MLPDNWGGCSHVRGSQVKAVMSQHSYLSKKHQLQYFLYSGLLLRVTVETPFHLATLQSLLQLLGLLAQGGERQCLSHCQEQHMVQSEPSQQEGLQHSCDSLATGRPIQEITPYLYLPSDPSLSHQTAVFPPSSCSRSSDASVHTPSLVYTLYTSMQQDKEQPQQQNSQAPAVAVAQLVHPKDLLNQLQLFCDVDSNRKTAQAAAAAAAACSNFSGREVHKGKDSVQQVNARIVSQIKSHDFKAVAAMNQQQSGLSEVCSSESSSRKGMAVLHHLHLSLQALTEQHMAQLVR